MTPSSSWRLWNITSVRACALAMQRSGAMEEVGSPVIAIALILAAVFIPTAAILQE